MSQNIEKKAIFEKIAYQEGSTLFISGDHPEQFRLAAEAEQSPNISDIVWFLDASALKFESHVKDFMSVPAGFKEDIEGELQIIQQCPALPSPK